MPITPVGLLPALHNLQKAGVLALYESAGLEAVLHRMQEEKARCTPHTLLPIRTHSIQQKASSPTLGQANRSSSYVQNNAPTPCPAPMFQTKGALSEEPHNKNLPSPSALSSKLLREASGGMVSAAVSASTSDINSRQNQDPAFTPIPFPQWPPIWKNWSKRLGSSLVIWTYYELGTDLGGKPSAERRALMQHMLSSLKHPKGTHAFWPMSAPCTGAETSSMDLQPQPDLFWSGVALAQARFVIVLGEAAFQALETGLVWLPHGQTQFRGKKLILEKDPADLLHDPAALDGVMTLLSAALAPVLSHQNN